MENNSKKIWAIDKKWDTIKEFHDNTEVLLWLSTQPIYFQILYCVNNGPVHVWKP